MKAIITKTSEWVINPNNPPIPNASLEYVTRIDVRSCKTIEEAREEFWFKQWYDSGVNHREEYGRIVCDLIDKEQVWVVDINSIDDMEALYKEHGNIIIRGSWNIKEYPITLEIYDDYRE